MMTTSDVVIIGGGIHGTALSYELASAGHSVTLLERKSLADGASGGPGFRGVRTTDRDIRELPLMRIAHSIWPDLVLELGGEHFFYRTGGLSLFDSATSDDPGQIARIRALAKVQTDSGIACEVLDQRMLTQLEPGLSEEITGAIYTPSDGVANHTRATTAYAAAAQAAGANILENTEAVHIAAKDVGGVVRTTTDTFGADLAVVVLANWYTAALLRSSFDIDLPLWRYNPQATIVRSPSRYVPSRLINHLTEPFSAKAVSDDTVMLTGGRTGEWDDLHDEGAVLETVSELSRRDAGRFFPALADGDVVAIDASRSDSVSVDDIPYIDAVPGNPSIFFATGWSGHGFAIAPAVAWLLSQWIQKGQRPDELAPFSLARLPAKTATVEPFLLRR